MANSTDPFAESVHGTNPQNLIEKITRLKIHNCTYWKEHCFGLTAETIIDKAIGLKYCGGTYAGNVKPTAFLCLCLKLLQLQPEKDIVLEYIQNEDFKYLRLLGAFYLRMTGKPVEIYKYLEPLYNDYRKIAYRGMNGWEVLHVDEFIDALLVKELVCDVALPHLPRRVQLEDAGLLQPRVSALEDLMSSSDEEEEEEAAPQAVEKKAPTRVSRFSEPIAPQDVPVQNLAPLPAPVSLSAAPSISIYGPGGGQVSTSDSQQQQRDSRRCNDGEVSSRGERRDDRERDKDRDRDRQRDRRRDRGSRDRDDGGSRRRPRSREGDRRRHRESSSESRSRSRSRSRDRRHRKSGGRSRDRSRERDRMRSRDRDRRDRRHSRSTSYDRCRDGNRDKRGETRRVEEDRHARTSSSRPPAEEEDDDFVPEIIDAAIAASSKKASGGGTGSSKKFDKIFGKKKSSGKSGGEKSELAGAITAPEGSVEYWNQMRESLGMKKLKE